MILDWFQGSIDAPPMCVADSLHGRFGGSWLSQKPRQGYDQAMRLSNEDGHVCDLLFGGKHSSPHVVATGGDSEIVREFVMSQGWEHRVSRIDVCEDFDAPGSFDRIFETALGVVLPAGVKTCRVGDYDSETKARSLYLGAPSSSVRMRIYEKGAEMRAKYGVEASPDWTRVEIQVRPSGRAGKTLAAHLTKEQFWGVAGWSKVVADSIFGLEVPRTSLGSKYRKPELMRSAHYLVGTYGNTLLALIDHFGGPESFALQVKYHTQNGSFFEPSKN